jgi:peptidoglycan/LPS O-acetylase OafA/YrhL
MKQNNFAPIDLTPNASGYLDLIRSAAAMAVMFDHWRGFFFVDYWHLAPSSVTVPVKAMYFLTGFGHQAVMVFFVLSGFLISSSVLRNLGRSTWSWRKYAIDRGVRLYLVLVPGLLLGGLLDIVGIHFFNHSGIYSVPLPPFGYEAAAERLNMSSFFGSLLFLQTRFTMVFGSNSPLWSLFNEFWYYVLFPVLIWVILSAKRRSSMVAIYIGVAILAAWVLGGALSGFVVWLAGGSVALTARKFQVSPSYGWTIGPYILCAATFLGICLFAARVNGGWLGSDLAVGLAFTLLTHGIVQLCIPLGAIVLRLAKTFAGFSYSLYVLHFPLLLFVRAKWLPTFRWQPDGIHLLMGAGIAVGVILYAFSVASITERRTDVVRSWVGRQFAHVPRIADIYQKLHQKATL